MSQESIKKFINKMKSDTEFRAKIMLVENKDELLNLIHSKGFDCTLKELQEFNLELADDELDGITGGFLNNIINPALY